jgi:hypothetical protein
MYLHQSPVCKEGNIETCSQGKGSCPEGNYGGWGCSGCQYNNWDEYIKRGRYIKENIVIKENNIKKKYTKFEVAEYILGWSDADQEWLDIEGIKSILHNSMRMLEDKHDGIEANFERRKEQR